MLARGVCQTSAAHPSETRAGGIFQHSSIGSGVTEVGGDWQFRPGDNPAWCGSEGQADWQWLQVDASWGTQGYPGYSGIAWYRRKIAIWDLDADAIHYRLLIPLAEDAYEVYWNCKLIGSYGHLPPHPSWYYEPLPQSFSINPPLRGMLAIRIWRAPLDAFGTDDFGGLRQPPLIGAAEVIDLAQQSSTSDLVRKQLFDYSLVLLRLFIAALCLVLWMRSRSEALFLWVAIFTATPVALGSLEHLFLIPFSYQLARFLNQPLYVLYSVSLWFLLLYLLDLDARPRLHRLTRWLAGCIFLCGALDGILALFWGSATRWMQWADGFLATGILLLETYPLVLVAVGLRREKSASRWAVALAAFVLQMFHSVADMTALGQRFTHWSLYNSLIDAALFEIDKVEFTPEKLTSLALFAAILFALYRHIVEQQARRNVLEQEMQSAQEIQKVLIPDTVAAIEGYALSSAFIPAHEVGGDFFQILPNPDGSATVALGDVSGKGLKAAMNVSMIVGALRAQSATISSPGAILEALNHCLIGRMSGGFATGILLRLEPDGTVVLANAGHLPPFINGREFEIESALPLGIIADISYSELRFKLAPGDELVLYTDGLLEARDESGALFGFDRLRMLFALRPSAQQASQRAVDFGQEDDVTILTLTRLSAGQESSASLTSPLMRVVAQP
jgi:serine phosphatase RsbU (regulator of sigma subunit)